MSSDPILSVEYKFQKLMSFLASRQLARQRLPEIIGFYNQIKSHNNLSLFQSYFLQLFPYLEECFSRHNLIQTKPEFLQRLISEIPVFKETGLNKEHPQAWQRLKNTIIQCFAESCFNLGLYKMGLNSLEIKISGLSKLLKTLPGNNPLSNLQFIYQQLMSISKITSQDLHPVKQIIEEWEREQRLNQHTLPILFLDSGNTDNGIFLPGVIHDLYIQTRTNDTQSDHSVEINNHLFNDSRSLLLQIQDAMQAAVNQYTQIFNHRPVNFFHFIFSINQKEYFYTGESLGLPSALLIFKNLLENSDVGKTVQIQPRTLITGNIDMQGQVMQLSETAIIHKIDTAFFSQYTHLILPKSNLNLAENRVRTLQQKYPGKQFNLLPVENLNDCFSLDQISLKEFSQPSSAWKFDSNAPIYLTAVLLVFFSFWWVMRDVNPVNLKMDGKVLRAFNRGGNEVWNYQFDFEPTHYHYHPDKKDEFQKKLWINKDFNNDGKNETVFATAEKDEKNAGRIYYFNHDGKLKWMYKDSPKISYGETNLDPFFQTGEIKPVDIDGDGIFELAVIFIHHLWYPAHVSLFNINGEKMGEYWHSGHLSNMKLIDVDGDNVQDLILGGTNNEYNKPVLLALDLSDISGHSPQKMDKYTPRKFPLSNELFYLKFPDIPSLNLPLNRVRAHIARIKILNDSLIQVSADSRWMDEANIHYLFNNHFEPVNISFGDSFFMYYKELFNLDYSDVHDMDSIYQHLLKIEYKDGENWVYDLKQN